MINLPDRPDNLRKRTIEIVMLLFLMKRTFICWCRGLWRNGDRPSERPRPGWRIYFETSRKGGRRVTADLLLDNVGFWVAWFGDILKAIHADPSNGVSCKEEGTSQQSTDSWSVVVTSR